MRSYNKGEWSELYVVYSILHDRIIKIGNNDLQPTEQYIKVLELLMRSIYGEASYDITKNDVAITIDKKVIKTVVIDKNDLKRLSDDISAGEGRSFNVPRGDAIMEDLLLDSFKANSYQKSDLNTVSIMPLETTSRNVSFSIKSQLGGLSTLLNASKSTNFIYEVIDFVGDIEVINGLSNPAQVMKRIKAIQQAGGKFVFRDTYSRVFKQNLRLTDTLLPEVVAYMILEYFSHSGVSRISDIVKRIVPDLSFKTTELEVSTNVKEFLTNIALGMVPNTSWDGSMISGGCIFIKRDGEIICFTLYDMNQFKDYLFNNTKLDTASTTRHDFGKLFRGADGKLYFSLNLNIRFVH